MSFGPSDVWAVLGTPDEHLAEHWDGKRWSIVQLPDSHYTLNGLSGSAPDDIWIVGDGPGTITEHYDGSAWNIVPSANPPEGEPVLQSVTSINPDDVWAVGGIYALAPKVRTLVEHWDGTNWTIIPSPSPGARINVLDSVSGTGPDDVWAIGPTATSATTHRASCTCIGTAPDGRTSTTRRQVGKDLVSPGPASRRELRDDPAPVTGVSPTISSRTNCHLGNRRGRQPPPW